MRRRRVAAVVRTLAGYADLGSRLKDVLAAARVVVLDTKAARGELAAGASNSQVKAGA